MECARPDARRKPIDIEPHRIVDTKPRDLLGKEQPQIGFGGPIADLILPCVRRQTQPARSFKRQQAFVIAIGFKKSGQALG